MCFKLIIKYKCDKIYKNLIMENTKMKKIVLFALLCTVLFTACGTDKKSSTNEEEIKKIKQYTQNDYENSFLGYNSDNKYINYSLGIKADLPEEWSLYNNRDILERNLFEEVPAADDMLPDIKYTDLIGWSNEEDSFDSIILTFEKNTSDISASEIVSSEFETILNVLETSGYTDINAEIKNIEFLDSECDAVLANALLDGTNVSKLYLYTIIDERIVTIEIDSYEETRLYELVDLFTKAE